MKNVPNILSGFRILLVPVFVVLYFSTGLRPNAAAAAVYILASITDVLDGYIARKYDLITNLGRILDPLGDKLMSLAVIASLAIDRKIPMWALGFYAAKEIIMIACGVIIHSSFKINMPASNILGKIATVSIFLVAVTHMLIDIPRKVSELMVMAAICVAFMAFGSYALAFIGVIKSRKKEMKSSKE